MTPLLATTLDACQRLRKRARADPLAVGDDGAQLRHDGEDAVRRLHVILVEAVAPVAAQLGASAGVHDCALRRANRLLFRALGVSHLALSLAHPVVVRPLSPTQVAAPGAHPRPLPAPRGIERALRVTHGHVVRGCRPSPRKLDALQTAALPPRR